MKSLIALTAVAMLLLAGPSFAGQRPNYDCSGKNRTCVANCDRADEHKINAVYSQCLRECADALNECTERQSHTDTCATEFTDCIGNPDNKKETCREVYRICKNQYKGGDH